MAIGAPHPCIEVWLLADPAAIKKGMGLSQAPEIPEDLESLPAPYKDRKNNPKTILAQCCGVNRSELTTTEKDRVVAEIRVLQRLRDKCPTSFAPFADEVEKHIRPLFLLPGDTCAGNRNDPAIAAGHERRRRIASASGSLASPTHAPTVAHSPNLPAD
jgi:hypothetical protein